MKPNTPWASAEVESEIRNAATDFALTEICRKYANERDQATTDLAAVKKLCLEYEERLTKAEGSNRKLSELLQQMLFVSENADETGYVTDVGFVDIDKLHNECREALKP